MPTVDKLNRPLRDLRISVTDKCNFRCRYCMPAEIFGQDYPFLKRDEILSFEELIRLTKLFTSLGVEKIRLTGGEPLLRRDLSHFITQLRKINDIKDIALTTNGSLLYKFAQDLKDAGLQRVTVSLDSLNEERFQQINGVGFKVEDVLKGIEAANKAKLTVKINMVVQKGVNESDIIPMAKYFKEHGHILRFIEFMDVGTTNGWKMENVVPSKDILAMLREQFKLKPKDPHYFGEVAKRYVYEDGGEIGFISSVTEAFCSSCTRARISAEGKLYTCLFTDTGFDLKQLVRDTAIDDETLLIHLRKLWHNREDQYSLLRGMQQDRKRKKIEMSHIGG